MSNMKYFEFLNLTKEQLRSKMPVKNDTTGLKDSEEVKGLSTELDLIINLKEKLMEHINKLFQTLNEENVNTHMIKVLQKKTTEQAVIAENKLKYEAEIKKIEEINGLTAKSKQKITDKNEKFAQLKYVSIKIFQENEKFCADLESYIQLFNQKCVALSHGLGFYSEFNNRLNLLNQKIQDFVYARDIEKNGLLENFNTGSSINTNIFNPSLLNPNTNVITNMDYQYNYQPSCKHYSLYPNNQTNQSYNSYTNFHGYK